MRPGPPEPSHRPPDPSSNRALVAALLAVVVVAGLLLWVASAIRSHNALQDCIDSGRKDCVGLQERRGPASATFSA